MNFFFLPLVGMRRKKCIFQNKEQRTELLFFFSAKKTEIENPECGVFIQLSLFTEVVTRPDINLNLNIILIIDLKEKQKEKKRWLLAFNFRIERVKRLKKKSKWDLEMLDQ